jgi:hypothetical protein
MLFRPARQQLKLLRSQHRHEQVNQQPNGHESDENVFHGSKFSTRVGVKDADREKRYGHENEDHVLHVLLLLGVNL